MAVITDMSVLNNSLLLQPSCHNQFNMAPHWIAKEEQYYKMPPLFHLDDYERCLSQPGGAYCVGSFDLLPAQNEDLFHIIQQFSADPKNFNHKWLHRGFCVSARCGSHNGSTTLADQFTRCVKSWVYEAYGLQVKLAKLNYCETRERPYARPVDVVDLSFAALLGLLFLLNIMGTVQDVRTSRTSKQSSWLTHWSIKANYKQLVAPRDTGHPQLRELKPIYAIKTIAMMGIVLLHVSMVYIIAYSSNPRYMEKKTEDFKTIFFYNAPMLVQIFVVVTSFLLTYNLLLDAKTNPCKTLSMSSLPKRILQRIIRTAPTNAFVIGIAATWMSRLGAGPQWPGVVGAEEQRCRATWWTHLLFINNLVHADVPCLRHTWYIATDMQLYVVAVTIAMLLLRSTRPVKVLSSLLLISIVGNFIIAYRWSFKSSLFFGEPEIVRDQGATNSSFPWMYTSPWGNLSSSLMGVLLAHVHHHLQNNKFEVEKHKWFLIAHQSSLPLIIMLMMSGYWILNMTNAVGLALYTALDRPAFSLLLSIAIIGSLHKRDNQFLRWHGWEVLGKMQLSFFLVHWYVVVLPIIQRKALTEVSDFSMISSGILMVFLTHAAAVPLYLLVEAPAQKFFKALLL